VRIHRATFWAAGAGGGRRNSAVAAQLACDAPSLDSRNIPVWARSAVGADWEQRCSASCG
jgi:hypothetical protein